MYVYMCVCVCVFACLFNHLFQNTKHHTYKKTRVCWHKPYLCTLFPGTYILKNKNF